MKSLICTQNSTYEVKSTYNPDVCILTGGKLEMPLYIKTPNLDDYNKVQPYGMRFDTIDCGLNGKYACTSFNTSWIKEIYKNVPENMIEEINNKMYSFGKLEVNTANSCYTITPTDDINTCILQGGAFPLPIKIETPFFSFMGQYAPMMFTIKDIPENGSKAGQIFSTSPIEDMTILNKKGENITDRFQDEIGYDKINNSSSKDKEFIKDM